MSIFSRAKDKKVDQFATGLFRNPTTGQKINTASHGPLTTPDLNKQGFTMFGSQSINGGTMFSQDIGGGKQYQEFYKRPEGYGATPKPKAMDPAKMTLNGNTRTAETPEQKKNLEELGYSVARTVDSPPDPGTGLGTPQFKTALSGKAEQARQDALDSQIASINDQANQEIRGIKEQGARNLGSAKSFLAKAGALGRTISGAPVDTNLGVLSYQNNLMKQAVDEAYTNRDADIKAAKAGSAEQAQKQIDAYNKLMQSNFDNALKLLKEDREMHADERADRTANLQQQKLQFEMQKFQHDVNKENAQDALDSVDRMAESGIGLDQLSLELTNELEANAGLPVGSFEAYYQAKQDAENVANEENLLKLERAKMDILNIAEDNQLAREREQRQAKQEQRRIGLAGANYALSKQKFEYQKQKDQGESPIGQDEFAKLYSDEMGVSIGADAPEVVGAYNNYKAAFEANKRLQDIYDNPTASYKEYELSGGEKGTGKSYNDWLVEFKNKQLQLLNAALGK